MPSRRAPPGTRSVTSTGLEQERRYKPTTMDYAFYPPGAPGSKARQRADRAARVEEARNPPKEWTWDEIMHDEF